MHGKERYSTKAMTLKNRHGAKTRCRGETTQCNDVRSEGICRERGKGDVTGVSVSMRVNCAARGRAGSQLTRQVTQTWTINIYSNMRRVLWQTLSKAELCSGKQSAAKGH